jgi:hypothetical protein
MAKRKGRQQTRDKRGSASGKATARPNATLPGKRARSQARGLIAKTARETKRPKPTRISASTRKLPKISRIKPRKKTAASKSSVPGKRRNSLLGRVKSALRQIKNRKQFAAMTKRRKPTLSVSTTRKTTLSKQRVTAKRRARAHARMRFFADAKVVRADVSRRTASKIGGYLAAIRALLDRNDIEPLSEFAGKSVKDVHGNAYLLETGPNTLYRLHSVREPFEEIYLLVA